MLLPLGATFSSRLLTSLKKLSSVVPSVNSPSFFKFLKYSVISARYGVVNLARISIYVNNALFTLSKNIVNLHIKGEINLFNVLLPYLTSMAAFVIFHVSLR